VPRVLNFGSLNIDYVYSVEHFVRAGETLAATERRIFAGGKGLNQSVALARGGAEVFHAGSVGEADGGFLTSFLQTYNVNTDLVQKTACPSGHAIIQVEPNGQNCILLFDGANGAVTEGQADAALAHFGEGDFVVLQNEIANVPYIAKKAAERGLRVVFNPSPANSAITGVLRQKIGYLILNEIEAQMITGVSGLRGQLAALHGQFPHTAVVLTLGKDGVVYADGEHEYRHGIYDVTAVDTTAAGDTFTGFFIARLIAGSDVPEALRAASLASSIAVSRNGAAPSIPSLDEVMRSTLKPARNSQF
jgi:ribokinase